MTKTIKALTKYQQACNDLVHEFIIRYYTDDVDWYWIADRIGEVIQVNDYFWNMNDIVIAMEFGIPQDKLFAWKEYSDEAHFKGEIPINLTNYFKINI